MSLVACILAAACSGDAATAVSGPEEPVETATVSSVEMNPSNVKIQIEDSASLSLDVRTENGEPLDRDGEWTVRDTAVAVVTGQGSERRVRGRGEGTTRVIGTVDGVADSAEVEVTDGGSDDDDSGDADVHPAVVFDPDRYSSTQELRDDPYGVFSTAEVGGNYSLDTGTGYPGGDRTMRYDYVDQGCETIGIGREIPLPKRSKEVWIEAQVKFSPNFTDKNPDGCDAGYGPGDFKFIFGNISPDDGRFDMMLSRGIRMGSPRADHLDTSGYVIYDGNDGRRISTNEDANSPLKARITSFGINENHYLFDDRWHTIRIHWRASSDAHTPDGMMELWVDGVYRGGLGGFAINETLIRAVSIGRNKDQGQPPPSVETLWWGPVKAWTENPGW